MPQTKAQVTVCTTCTRIVELELLSPEMRSIEMPKHIQDYLLRDDEMLESMEITGTDSHLPNVKLENPFAGSRQIVGDYGKIRGGGLPEIKVGARVHTASTSITTPAVHKCVFEHIPATPAKANSNTALLLAVDETHFTSPIKIPTQKRRSASDGDVMSSIYVRDFAYDLHAIKRDLLKAPLKSRNLCAKIIRPRSPNKDEKFQAQAKSKAPF